MSWKCNYAEPKSISYTILSDIRMLRVTLLVTSLTFPSDVRVFLFIILHNVKVLFIKLIMSREFRHIFAAVDHILRFYFRFAMSQHQEYPRIVETCCMYA